ncbi:MAG: alpha-1,2-fucosyltransferase [Puia sp.]
MIVVKLSDGLGNQMFQYAAARSLSLKWNEKLLMDTASFGIDFPNVDKRIFSLNIFDNIKPAFSSRFLTGSFYMPSRWDNRFRKIIRQPRRHVLKENKHAFDESFYQTIPPVLLDGYWQSEMYFKPFEKTIREDFTFRSIDGSDHNFPLLAEIQDCESVSVHVRRGDYYKYGNQNMFQGICDKPYFQKAISWFLVNKRKPKFFFFSEDPEWIFDNLKSELINMTVVSGNLGDSSWKDMFLMSKCKHQILSNSSFSWWSAWLNKNGEKSVIAPIKWFNTEDPLYEPNDIVPAHWIRL